MTKPVPNDGISAFFDQELSPAENEAVADHLLQSEAARNELAEIRLLSEALRSLPRNSAPANLRAQVRNQLAARAGGAASADAPTISTSVFKVGKWLAAAAALVLLVSWLPSIWKTPPVESQSNIAANSPTSQAQNQLPELTSSSDIPKEEAAPVRERMEQPSDVAILAEQQVPKAAPSLGEAASTLKLPAPGSSGPPNPAGANFADSLMAADKVQASDPQVERILAFADQHPNRVVIVEVTADDLPETLALLQQSLAQNAIAPANFPLKNAEPSPGDLDRKPGEGDAHLSLYVQSSPRQLSLALKQLREKNARSQIEPQTALAMSSIPVLEEGERRFGRTLSQSIQKYESAETRQSFGGASRTLTKSPDSNLNKDEQTDPGNKPKTPGPPAPGSDSQSAKAFSMRTEMAAPKALKAAQSFQMLVQTPADRWAKKASDTAEPPPQEPPPQEPAPDEAKAEPAQRMALQAAQTPDRARKIAEEAPVRLMFIFRESTPAPAK